jgi:glutamate-1-semialdehyde 2,1-aminomutase
MPKLNTLERPATEAIYERICQVTPGGVNSPVRTCKAMGQLPLIVERGAGDVIYDADGLNYIDYCMSWGALIHGHAHPEIVNVLQKQIKKGTSFGITTEVEELLARKVVELMPAIEQVRFVSSGTEATMSAARLARGFTCRKIVVKFNSNYHGHADFFLVKAGSGVMHLNQTSSSKGIPDEIVKYTISLPFNDIEAVAALFEEKGSEIACVILEPIAGNMGVVPATQAFIEALRKKTKESGALLIFDEVITGFRVAKGGASAFYGVEPDLACLGKIVGGGLPAAAFGGRRDIMAHLAPLGQVYQGGTLSGNPLAMVAGLKSLEMLAEPGFYEEMERKTDLLLNPIQEYILQNNLRMCIQRAGSMFTLFFGKRSVKNGEEAMQLNGEGFASFFRHLFAQGIYIPPLQQEAWFISMAHTDEHLIRTGEVIIDYLQTQD